MPAASYLHNSQKFYFIKLDLKGHYTYVNNHFAQYFSFLKKEFAGVDGTIVIHPRDYNAYYSALDECFESADCKCNVLLRMVKEGGGCFLTDWEFSADFDTNGRPEGVSCIGFNTTEASYNQLRLEMKLQSLKLMSDNSSDGILMLDKNYKILAYNKPAENLSLELYKKQYLPGDDFRKYVRPEAQHFFYRQFNSALQGVPNEETFEMTVKNNVKLWLKVQMTPVYDDSNSVVSSVAVITKDVTLLQDLNNRLNVISAMQSHQIRRPVANMISLINLVNTEKLDEREKEYMHLLKVSIEQLEEEIRQIVKTARNT